MSEWTETSSFVVPNAWSCGLPTNLNDVGYVVSAGSVTLTTAPKEQTMKPERTVVLVRWKDAHAGESGWLDMDEYDDDGFAIVDTVGFLVGADEPGGKHGHVTVWQSISEEDGIGPFHIPVEMVLETVLLNS